MDTFQGHYKDGQDGTRDHRAASSIHLILILIFVYGSPNLGSYIKGYALNFIVLGLVAASLFYALARPCRKDHANIIQSLLYAFTAGIIQLIVLCSYCRIAMRKYLAMLLCLLVPHIILSGYIVYKITKSLKISVSLPTDFGVIQAMVSNICNNIISTNCPGPMKLESESTGDHQDKQRNGSSFDEYSPLLNQT